jgi:hypothetical protein
MQNILARIQFKIMKLTKIVVGYYILSILSGLCSILSINLSLLQKRWVEIEKRRRIFTILLLHGYEKTKRKKEKKTTSILDEAGTNFFLVAEF